jgi:hypothetical protein
VTCGDACGMIVAHVGAHAGSRGTPAAVGSGRSRSGTGREGRRDRGAPPSADGAAAAGPPATVHPVGPDRAGDAGPAAAARAVAGLPGHPWHAAALASRVGGPPVDVPTYRPAPAWSGLRGGGGGAAVGAGEPAMGVRADRGGVPQAGPGGVRDDGAPDPAPAPAGPGAPAWRWELGAVPAGAGRPGRWRWTSSPWRPSGCAGCTSCLWWRWSAGGCTWPGSPPTRPETGWCRPPATC